MYKQFLVLLFLIDFCLSDEIKNLKDNLKNNKSIEDEPLISMTSNFVPKYFPNQQKAYHQQYDKTTNHLSTKKLINKPKLGKQISLDHHSFNNVAESVLQSTNMLIGSNFQDELKNDFKNDFKNEFGREYPYKPTFLRFNPSDGRNDIKPSPRIDYNKNYHNDKKDTAYKSAYNPNYEEYKDLTTVKEPQITYSANSKYLHPPALPLYNPNYASYRPPTYQLKPNYSSKEQTNSKYYSSNQPALAYSSPAPSSLVSHQSDQPLQPNYQPKYESNYRPNYQPNYTKDEDKSLEETIAELPNILAKSGLISANSAKQSKTDKQTLIKPVVVLELPHKYQQNNDKHYPPYHYVLNKDHHLKESEEAHKKYEYDSHHSYNQNYLTNNNQNRKHKDEYYSNDNDYQTVHYIHKDVREPYTTYSTANSSEIGDYESSSIYSEIKTKDESRKHNKTKNYYVIYKLDDRRFEDELNHHINHHLRNEEEKINSGEQNDYHEVINLSPIIGENGDSLDRLFTIDTINSYIKDESNNKKEYSSQEEYVDPIDELKNYSTNQNDKDYKPKSKIYQSMRNRDQYKQFNSADGREIIRTIKYGEQNPLNYLNNNEKEYKDKPISKSIDNLELESIIHNEPDLKRINSIQNYNNTSSNLFDSYNYKKNLTNKSKIIKYEPERLFDRERIYLFSNTDKKQQFDKENLKPLNYGIDQTAATINENRNLDNKNNNYYNQSPTTKSNSNYNHQNHPNSKESLIEESYKSEYNDQSHLKETSVFKLKTYDDYLHENYGKEIIRPKY